MSNQRIIQLDLSPFQLSSLFHLVSLWIDLALILGVGGEIKNVLSYNNTS